MNEENLLPLLKNGDPLAFRQLVESCQHMVYHTVLGIVNDQQEAEDVSQEVFIQVFRSVGSFRGESKLATWLYRIAITKALDWERKKKVRSRINTLASWVGMGEEVPATDGFQHPGLALEQKENAARLWKAIRQLPDNQRICFLLLKTEGLNYLEVAEVMELSVKAVESLMHRAKENLRKILKHSFNH